MQVRMLFCIYGFLCALVCQSQLNDGRIGQIVEDVNQNHPNQAIEVLLANSAPFQPKDRELLLDAFSRNAPSGEWVPFLQKLCEVFPQDADYRYLLARTYWRSGDEKAAMVECEEVLRLAPNDPLLLYRIAAIAYATNEFTKAKEWLSRLLELNPNSLDGMLLYGTVLAREGNDQSAKPYLEKVLAIEPGHALANFELGKLANREGDSQRAEVYLKQAISGYPFFREAVNALLVALSRQKKMDELKETQEIFEYLRGWPASKLNRMMYVFRNPGKASTKEAEQLSIELSKVKRSDLAEQYIQNRLDVGIASEQEKLLLARIYYNRRDYPKAAVVLDALDENAFSKSLLYVYLRTLALLRTNRAPEAGTFFAKHSPDFPESDELKSIGQLLSRSAQSRKDDDKKSVQPDYAIRFVDVTISCGLQSFQHKLGAVDKPWITDAMGSGVAVGDYDNDGDDDIYFTNGRPLLNQPDENWRNELFRNDGGKFVDVTNVAGVGDVGFGMVSIFGDVNNDGWLDIFVGNIGPNTLYISNGDGTFSKRGMEAGIDDAGYCAAAGFVDIDRDGDLDLYVGNYVDFDPKRDGEKRLNYHGEDVFVGPLVFEAQPDLFYLNDGNGVFTNKADKLGLPQEPSRAMGAVFFDLENDDDLDLYITNDSTFNTVLENKGDGHFNDVSFPSGGAFTENGVEGASMGIAPGDYNNDGYVDLYITSYERQTDVLFENQGNGFLTDVTSRTGLASSRMLITWGAVMCDFDASGWLDVFTANGHMYPQVANLSLDLTYNQGVSFYQNNEGRFDDVSQAALDGAFQPKSGRGAALLDFDNDGDMDVVINNMDSQPTLLENRSAHGSWLQVKLKANSAQTYGVRVVVRQGDKTWTRVVDGGSGYLSQNSSVLHFGFGRRDAIDSLTVYWRHRDKQVIENPSLNQRITISPNE